MIQVSLVVLQGKSSFFFSIDEQILTQAIDIEPLRQFSFRHFTIAKSVSVIKPTDLTVTACD